MKLTTLILIFSLVAIASIGLLSRTTQKANAGKLAYENNGCNTCHGDNGKGTDLAPTLAGLKKNWKDRNALAAYIRNATAERSKYPRLKKMEAKYTQLQMPTFNFSEKEIGALIDYLMKIK